MKLFLSSYNLGDEPNKLSELAGSNRRVAVIPNALDHFGDTPRRLESEQKQMDALRQLGLEPEILDLRSFFNNEGNLPSKLETFGMTWILGGNAFVLRTAMKLSRFDELVVDYAKRSDKKDFVYAGFSAGVCVLQASLKGIEFVDDPDASNIAYNVPTLWTGLGILDYVFVPHFKSDHKESDATNIEVKYYLENGINFKTLRDGEVIISNT